MWFSVDITTPHRSFMFSQASIKDIGGLTVGSIIEIYICLDLWKRCQRVRALTRRCFLPKDHLQSWRYNWKLKGKSVFFALHSSIFLSLLSFHYFFLFYMAWRSPLRVMKSKWNTGDTAQIIDTIFINSVIYWNRIIQMIWKWNILPHIFYPWSQPPSIHFCWNLTALFNNMRTLKGKAQPTNAFFTTVNGTFGGSSQLPTIAVHCFFVRTVLKDWIMVPSVVVGGWEEPPNIWLAVAKSTIVGWALNFRVRILLKGAVNLFCSLKPNSLGVNGF